MLLVGAAHAAVAACGPPRPQPAYIAPSESTITWERQVLREVSGKQRHIITVRNASTVEVTVIATRLTDCQNVQNACGERPVSIPIAPGARRRVLDIVAARDSAPFTYRWSYRWQVSRAAAAAAMRAALPPPAPIPVFELRLASDTPGVGLFPMDHPTGAGLVYIVRATSIADPDVEQLRLGPSGTGGLALSVTLTDQGAARFDAFKRESAGKLVAVLLDSRVVEVAPVTPPAADASAGAPPRVVTIAVSPRDDDLPRIREKIAARWPQ